MGIDARDMDASVEMVILGSSGEIAGMVAGGNGKDLHDRRGAATAAATAAAAAPAVLVPVLRVLALLTDLDAETIQTHDQDVRVGHVGPPSRPMTYSCLEYRLSSMSAVASTSMLAMRVDERWGTRREREKRGVLHKTLEQKEKLPREELSSSSVFEVPASLFLNVENWKIFLGIPDLVGIAPLAS